jgi:hypothetical protein
VQKTHKVTELNCNGTCLEQKRSYKYLGSIVNGGNTIGEEIKTRIIQGNKAYYANQNLFKSKLIAKS